MSRIIKKKQPCVLSFCLMVWLTLGLGTSVQAATTVKDEYELQAAIKNATGEITVELGGDIDLTSTITINGNSNVTIDGNGFTISIANRITERHFKGESGCSFTIQDVTLLGDSYYRSTNNGGEYLTGYGGVEITGGDFTMEGAVIENCYADSGGGVDVFVGNFTMKGGKISGCTASYGGGVSIYLGNFTMSDSAAIVECGGYNGGGVNISRSSFTMKGGAAIKDCVGGGVVVYSGSFTMEDGIISGCSTKYGGAGVVVYYGSSFTMKDGATITDCVSDDIDGGVCVNDGSFTMEDGSAIRDCEGYIGGGVSIYNGSFEMKGGTISGCKATLGGGVFIDGDVGKDVSSFTMSSGATIEDCKADYGGGVFIKVGSFTMAGGKISGCTANKGGGVYVGNGSFTMKGGQFYSNTATTEGADIFYSDNSINSTTHTAYIGGYEDGTFKPNGSITRAEVAQMLYNIMGANDSGQVSTLTDVIDNSWYYAPVTYLTSTGIISGYSDGTFKPYSNITRAEFVTLVAKYAGLSSNDGASFPDVSKDHWAYEYISSAEQAGFIGGYGDGTFRPDSDLTRAEAVTILNTMLGRTVDEDSLAELTMPFSDVAKTHWAYYQILEAAVNH